MADFFAGLGHSLGILLRNLGIHDIDPLAAGLYILGATAVLALCSAVHSAVRVAFLRCSVQRK